MRKITDLLGVVAVAVVSLVPAVSLAGDPYSDVDFSLRFPAGMTRFATYGDVAGVGGASAGSKWSSSINPASTAWQEEPPRHVAIGQQFTHLWFDNGLAFSVPAESVTVDLGPLGYITGAAAQIASNRETMMNNGLDFRFAGDLGQLAWSKKFTPGLAGGFAFTYTDSVGRLSMDQFEVAKSNCDSYGVRGGLLGKITDRWLAGVVLDYGWSSDRTSMAGFPDVIRISRLHAAVPCAAGRLVRIHEEWHGVPRLPVRHVPERHGHAWTFTA